MSSQIAHIFGKDVRRHWREIALATTILAAFVWVEPQQWMRHEFRPEVQLLTGLLTALVPIGWAFLIVRLVHEENLVGDRQFWVTRPYQWQKLLAEKLIFVTVFVNIPLLVADVVLLFKAGFLPTRYLSGLLALQLLWMLIFVLPAVTLGTITSSIGQAVLVVLGTILFIVAFGLLRFGNRNFDLPRLEPISGSLQTILIVVVGAAVVTWQYARRSTLRSRVLLVSAVLAALFLMPLVRVNRRSIAQAYPQMGAGEGVPLHLAFDSEKRGPQTGGIQEKNAVMIGIPLLVSGIRSDSMISVQGTALTIEAPGGQNWSSRWIGNGSRLFPNDRRTQTYLTIDKDFFEQVKATPVSLYISFAIVEFREKEIERVVSSTERFSVPGEGHCSVSDMGGGCLFPLRTPFMMVTARLEEMTCTLREKQTPLPPGISGYGLVGYGSSSPAEFGISPVQVVPLDVGDWGELDDPRARPGICPGTPLSFGILEEMGGMRTELQIDGIRLADYELKNPGVGAIGVEIGMLMW